jgi:hypothetical protein
MIRQDPIFYQTCSDLFLDLKNIFVFSRVFSALYIIVVKIEKVNTHLFFPSFQYIGLSQIIITRGSASQISATRNEKQKQITIFFRKSMVNIISY